MTTGTIVMATGNSQKYPCHTNIWVWTFFLLCENWPVQVVDYVGVFVFPHHQDLIDDQLFLGLLLQVHLLDGHLRRRNEEMGEWKHNRAWRLGEREWISHTVVTAGSTYLLACCYVDGCVHSAGCSGGTHDQNHFRHQWACRVLTEQLHTEPSLWFDIISSILSRTHKVSR